MGTRVLAVNERGYRVGQDHHHAVLTDAEVDLIRELREAHRWTYDALAEKFEVSKSAIACICRYERRAQTVARLKETNRPHRQLPTAHAYTPDIAREICVRVAAGESLHSICTEDRMPSEATLRRWVKDDLDGFSTQYGRARAQARQLRAATRGFNYGL